MLFNILQGIREPITEIRVVQSAHNTETDNPSLLPSVFLCLDPHSPLAVGISPAERLMTKLECLPLADFKCQRTRLGYSTSRCFCIFLLHGMLLLCVRACSLESSSLRPRGL